MDRQLKENSSGITIFDFFDNVEKSSLEIGFEFFKDIQWSDAANRLLEGSYTGVGTYRLLTRLRFQYLGGSVERLIDFYETAKRPQDEPHYEDLLVTLVYNIIANLLADLIEIVAVKKIKNYCLENESHLDKLVQKHVKVYGNGISYLVTSYWMRELKSQRKISESQFNEYIQYSKIEFHKLEFSKEGNIIRQEHEKYSKLIENIAQSEGFDPDKLSNSFIKKIIAIICKKFKNHELDELIAQNERYFNE